MKKFLFILLTLSFIIPTSMIFAQDTIIPRTSITPDKENVKAGDVINVEYKAIKPDNYLDVDYRITVDIPKDFEITNLKLNNELVNIKPSDSGNPNYNRYHITFNNNQKNVTITYQVLATNKIHNNTDYSLTHIISDTSGNVVSKWETVYLHTTVPQMELG